MRSSTGMEPPVPKNPDSGEPERSERRQRGMKRHTSRILPTAVTAVLVLGACGGTDDEAVPAPPATQPAADAADGSEPQLRAPTPIEVTSGSGSSGGKMAANAAAEGGLAATDAMVGDEMMVMPMYEVEFVLGEGLVLPTDDTGLVYDASVELTAEQVVALGAAFGLDAEPVRIDDGYTVSWRVGPEDGSAPSLWIYDDAQQWWNYSSAWATTAVADVGCAVSVDSEGNESVETCPTPAPPVGVPTAAEAEARATELLVALGIDPATVTFDTYADEWYAGTTANLSIDDRAMVGSVGFGFGAEGVLQYASGGLATPAPVGPYPLIDLETALQRLEEQNSGFGAMYGGVGLARDAVAEPAVISEPAVAPPDGTVPAGTMPVETITVTLVDVEADLWWAWDVDGNAWLLPAYRLIGDDGGWYVVPAVTDEFLIQVDPPVEPMPVEPMPVETIPGTVVEVPSTEVPDGQSGSAGGSDGSVPVEPTVTVPAVEDPAAVEVEVRALFDARLPIDLASFTAEAEGLGYSVRVVVEDGVELPVTMDFSLQRINVETTGGDVVAIVNIG